MPPRKSCSEILPPAPATAPGPAAIMRRCEPPRTSRPSQRPPPPSLAIQRRHNDTTRRVEPDKRCLRADGASQGGGSARAPNLCPFRLRRRVRPFAELRLTLQRCVAASPDLPSGRHGCRCGAARRSRHSPRVRSDRRVGCQDRGRPGLRLRLPSLRDVRDVRRGEGETLSGGHGIVLSSCVPFMRPSGDAPRRWQRNGDGSQKDRGRRPVRERPSRPARKHTEDARRSTLAPRARRRAGRRHDCVKPLR